MTISGAFGTYISTGSKFLNTALLTLTLIGIQAVLDSNFQCPRNTYSPVLAGFYSLSFFLCPAIVFVFVGLYYFPGFNKRQCCPCWSGNWACIYVVIQLGKPPLIWFLITMADGRYLSCFVVAVSNYQLDRDLYLYIFQTSGMLILTVVVILIYSISRCTCPCLEESRATYQMLGDVETILVNDEAEKEAKEERRKFLCALEHGGEYKERIIPKYMMDKEDVIVAKLKPPTPDSN